MYETEFLNLKAFWRNNVLVSGSLPVNLESDGISTPTASSSILKAPELGTIALVSSSSNCAAHIEVPETILGSFVV
jgi:hypothetical protein